MTILENPGIFGGSRVDPPLKCIGLNGEKVKPLDRPEIENCPLYATVSKLPLPKYHVLIIYYVVIKRYQKLLQ